MFKLINFSHPLSAVAKNELEKMIGGEFFEHIVHVQIDLTFKKSLLEQLEEIMRTVKGEYHFIIPPSLGAIGYCLSANYDWCSMGWYDEDAIYHRPQTVIIARVEGKGFVPVHIVPE